MKYKNKLLSLGFILILVLTGCDYIQLSTSTHISTDEQSSSFESSNITEEIIKTREDRNLSIEPDVVNNSVDEGKLALLDESKIITNNGDFYLISSDYRIDFIKNTEGYSINFVYAQKDKGTASVEKVMFKNENPAKLYIKAEGQIEKKYENVVKKPYGILADASITSKKGSVFKIKDRYYFTNDNLDGAFNVKREIEVISASEYDRGFESVYDFQTVDNKTTSLEWYVPNYVYGNYPDVTFPNKIFRETLLGLPMAMMRNKTTGYSLSLARYQPVIDYSTNSYACIGIFNGKTSGNTDASSIEINYPTRDTSRKYFSVEQSKKIVYDLSLIANKSDNYDDAMINCYTKQYKLQNQRIVNTDIDEVYNVVNEDFKKFMLSNRKNGMTSYGLPWRVTIENGKIGPMSYQSGFVGQQIPCAYNMMVYGVKNNDQISLKNGINIIDFWINSAKLMTDAGVPMVWFDGSSNRWASYPTFLRMAVDTMEGILDAYRLAVEESIETHNWLETLVSCADWMVKAQNNDGSWYRCYNYQGTYYKGTESDIGWNPGDIARSESKNNSTMPIRFLGKMYELTKESKYYQSLIKGGEFVYKELYPKHVYYGGTCDNPDAIDKEAGVFAMYAYDTLYTLTKDEKWIKCLKQATIFTMSSVIVCSFKINPESTTLKAANALKAGYTDGLSFICVNGTSIDNYAAYIYYELFRTYIYTKDSIFYDMAEFIQQNTKSTMDWDGKLGYSYKSLTPEASTIYSFGFGSATDDDDVQGVWLPWQSAANAEPIAKMYETFGKADVKEYKDTPITELSQILSNHGVGGKPHKSLLNK